MATHIADGTGSSVYPYSALQVTSGAAVVLVSGTQGVGSVNISTGVGSVLLLATASGTGTVTPVLCTPGGAIYFSSGAL